MATLSPVKLLAMEYASMHHISILQARSALVDAIDAVPLTSPGFMMQVNELMIYLLYVPQEITLSALVS